MIIRLAGSVVVIHKKGLISIIATILLLGLIIYFIQIIMYKEQNVITERKGILLDDVLQDRNLLKGIHILRKDKNVIGQKGSDQKLHFKDDKPLVKRFIKRSHKQPKLKHSIIGKPSNNKPLQSPNDIFKHNYKMKPKTNGGSKRVVMAMDVIPLEERKNMEDAAKSMHLPHRPPDIHYNINVTLSDHTSLDRDLPDTRPPVCATLPYDLSTLPMVSIIIPFFNEAPTMLLRNIHSILNRTPNDLLEEIILVDDMSYDAPLMLPLDTFIENDNRITLLRNEKREGLIVSRMRGARIAKAPVILFLDAHCEVNVGWIEPILDQLLKNPKQVLQPFIDGVDNMNLVFTAPSNYFKGTFSWDLRYTWTKLTDYEQERAVQTGQPFDTPTLVGCAIAVVKDYFFEIGSFDEGMYVWGGENLELAFRAWMCGGKVATVTCSRVGHVFKQSPNKFDGTKGKKEETIQKNLIRVADVWMDGMRKFFYGTTLMFSYKRFKLGHKDLETLKERTELRKRLKCHNFEWYLYNVFPEMLELPPMDSAYFGEIMNIHSRACWEITEDYYVGLTYFCFEHKIIPKNNFILLRNGLMKYRDKCIRTNLPKPYLSLDECPQEEDIAGFGRWEVINQGENWGGIKVNVLDKKGVTFFWCIVQVTNAIESHKGEQMPQLGQCDMKDGFQLWIFTYPVDFTLVPEYMSVYQEKPY